MALRPDKTILQMMSGLVEHGVSNQMRETHLKIVAHPSFGLPTNEVQVDVVAASKAVVFLCHNPLQEYIDKVCSMGCPLTRRETRIPRHIQLIR